MTNQKETCDKCGWKETFFGGCPNCEQEAAYWDSLNDGSEEEAEYWNQLSSKPVLTEEERMLWNASSSHEPALTKEEFKAILEDVRNNVSNLN
jgi:hypothetical protein